MLIRAVLNGRGLKIEFGYCLMRQIIRIKEFLTLRFFIVSPFTSHGYLSDIRLFFTLQICCIREISH